MASQKQDTVAINLSSFLTPAAILLAGLVIAVGLFFGLRGSTLPEKGPSPIVDQPAQPELPPDQPPEAGQAVTSIDDDAVMGDKETAQAAIVEFSDYECPFCKRFWSETLPQIKENFIDTGQVILVYRDLPLGFHEPAATREANAAECARDQGDDEVFYQFHDKIYEQTPGNGAGIAEEDLVTIGVDLGLNKEKLTKCIKDQEFAEEIKRDAQDASQAGISGTPGFVIGKLGQDSSFEGVIISGAQPYSNFEQTINKFLKK